MARILALDRGNDSLKAALIESGKIARRWREVAAHPEKTIRRILEECTPTGIVISSVVPAWSMGALRVLRKLDIGSVIEVGPALALPFDLLVESPEKLGSDRIAAAAGVAAAGEREAVIVDAGTAVTIDVLSREGFRGGVIFPGAGLLARSLHEGTAALPLVEASRKEIRLPGKNTKEAIAAGVRWGLVGAVRELVTRSRETLSDSASVWLTGGGAAAFEEHINVKVKREPDLVFIGMDLLFALNTERKR
jgi:type III pantothenate kinase